MQGSVFFEHLLSLSAVRRQLETARAKLRVLQAPDRMVADRRAEQGWFVSAGYQVGSESNLDYARRGRCD